MSSVDDSHRRAIVPEVERQVLRYRMFQKMRSFPRYRSAIDADLRPLWKAAAKELPHTDFLVKPFHSIRGIGRPGSNWEATTIYVEAVYRIAKRFLLLQDGEPAIWACDFIHVDVEPLGGESGLVPPNPFEPGGLLRSTDKPSQTFNAAYEFLTIMVNPAGAEISDGQYPDAVKTREWIPAGQFMRFAEWKELREAAEAKLEQLLISIQATYEDWYPNQPNPSTWSGYTQRAETVASILMDASERHRIRDDAKNLQRFAAMIRLDYPGQKLRRKARE